MCQVAAGLQLLLAGVSLRVLQISATSVSALAMSVPLLLLLLLLAALLLAVLAGTPVGWDTLCACCCSYMA
jgi:hypothetical protein